jgi:hypothetical protein
LLFIKATGVNTAAIALDAITITGVTVKIHEALLETTYSLENSLDKL